jgi:arginase family enzyme
LSENSQKIKLFGVALDPSDDPWSLELKRAWMANRGEARENDASVTDPYDAVTGELKEILDRKNIRLAGKFPVPSWLRPKPAPEDYPLVTVQNIGDFYDSGGLLKLIKQLQGFLEKSVFPAMPLMLGIDHSSTMGVISALAKKYGPENLSVIVLDQHFDAVPLSVRLAETENSAAGSPVGVPLGLSRVLAECPDHCCCGNFWAYLMAEGKVRPENLSFIGVADYPEKSSGDSPFQKTYLDFEKKGCRFFPLSQFDKPFARSLRKFIHDGIKTPLIYVSLDLDVGSYNFTWAARYMDQPGISRNILLEIASQIRDACRKKNAALVGLDIMEFNMHFLGLETDDGAQDVTIPLVGDFIDRLVG